MRSRMAEGFGRLYWVFYRDNGKENGNYRIIGLYRDYIGFGFLGF